MSKFLAVCLLFSFVAPASACLNKVSTYLKDGSVIYSESLNPEWPMPHQFIDKATLQKALRSLDTKYGSTKDVDFLSDKGYVLIVLGRYAEAIALYQRIEKIAPNRYATASNIGTAYELSGDNAQALRWIEKAYRLNPDSHEGSEWIHVNILKTKVSGVPIDSDSLLNVDFGSGSEPKFVSRTAMPADKLRQHLISQLRERISFVKPKDPIVAQLFFDFGNLDLSNDEGFGPVGVEANYERAIEYGYSGPLLAKRMQWVAAKKAEDEAIQPVDPFSSTRPKADASLREHFHFFITHMSQRTINLICGVAAVGLGSLLALFWFFWRRRRSGSGAL